VVRVPLTGAVVTVGLMVGVMVVLMVVVLTHFSAVAVRRPVARSRAGALVPYLNTILDELCR
jgi:uncharacterized membrane protein (DUF485 family)